MTEPLILDVLNGPVRTARLVSDPMIRASLHGSAGGEIEIDFVYLGPTGVLVPLSSGEMRVQIGLELLSQDPCNVIYAMWRFSPSPGLVVQTKLNPGQGSYAQCQSNGYSTIVPTFYRNPGAPTVGREYKLHALLAGTDLSVDLDGAPIWRGQIPADAAVLKGPVGFRSDNARYVITRLLGDL